MTDPFDIDAAAAERLDAALEQLMADRRPPSTPELAEILAIAAELRALPSAAFKARLKAELHAAAVPPAWGPPVMTDADIAARLAELAGPPQLVAHDPRAAAHDLPELAMRFLAPLGSATIVVSRYATDDPIWERHPGGDELLYVLEGGLDVTTRTADGSVHDRVDAGSLFICRRGAWHWPRPRGMTTVLSITPGEGTQHGVVPGDEPPPAPTPARITCDLPAALRDLPTLIITRDTTEDEASGAVREVGWLEDRLLGVMRFAGETPWERHPDGDELLHVLDGEIDVTVLTDDGTVHVDVAAGSLFVCPRGLWHRQRPKTTATLLFATPTATIEASWADDPRI